MDYTVSPINKDDCKSIIDLFNYCVENSFAAYPENKLTYEAFDVFLQMSRGYPTATIKDEKKNGFKEAGRFKGVCRKKGRVFDTVWMQKML